MVKMTGMTSISTQSMSDKANTTSTTYPLPQPSENISLAHSQMTAIPTAHSATTTEPLAADGEPETQNSINTLESK
jgi:hypothetical protein